MEICPVEIAAELQLECDMFDDISMSKLTVMVTGSDHADLAVDIPYCEEICHQLFGRNHTPQSLRQLRSVRYAQHTH